MSTRHLKSAAGIGVAALLSASAIPAGAQDQQGGYANPPNYGNSGPPPGDGYGPPPGNGYGPPPGDEYGGQSGGAGGSAPPPGQYAPPPQGEEQGGGAYEESQQQADAAYADAYSRWAARYCVDQRNNNTVAGALIGGVLGAGIGAAITHNPATGAVIGGAIGAGTGAVAGANSPAGGCPPGYVIAGGAPAFYYGSPYYAWAPAWYHPWVWGGGHWIYHPYRYWYWGHRAYWHPGWRAGPYRWRYRW